MMTYITRIRENKPGLSKSYKKLADYILDYYVEASFQTATQLAERFDIDTATVVRFAQHLGYEGYPELQKEIQDQVKQELFVKSKTTVEPETIPDIVNLTIEDLKTALDRTFFSIDIKAIAALVDMIASANRIIILADGPAQPSAYNLACYLEQGAFNVTIAHPGVTGTARAVQTAARSDLIIAIDMANEAPYFAPALREARAKGITAAVIAGAPSLASTNSADCVLTARANPEIGIEIISIEAITYILAKSIQQKFPQKYDGIEEAIAELSSMLH